MNVLVTGGAGFIGSHLVDLLVARNIATVVLDSLDPQVHGMGTEEPASIASHVRAGSVRFLRGDVRDREALQRALSGVDTVVHLAAAVGVGQSMYQPDYYVSTNAGGTGLLLDVIASDPSRVKKLIVASSMSLYGEGAYACKRCGPSRSRPRDEERLARGEWEPMCVTCASPLDPQPTPEDKLPEIASVYAATKKHQEDLCVTFGRAYGIPTFALRFFNAFGPRQSLSNPYTGVAAIFLSRLLNDRAPLIFEDGRQARDFVDVRDVAQALLLAAEFSGSGTHVLNVGTGRPTSVAEVARVLARHLGKAIEPVLLGRHRAGDIRHCYADTARARATLGFEAQRTLEDGLPALVEWCRDARPLDRLERSHEELRRQGLVQ